MIPRPPIRIPRLDSNSWTRKPRRSPNRWARPPRTTRPQCWPESGSPRHRGKKSKENGAVVVGTLVKVEPTEKGFVAHIKMPSDSSEMLFTTAKKPDAADGSTVVVLGLLNADGGGTALEIVSPSDEKTHATPAANPTPKPADSDKPAADKPAADKPPADAPPTADKPPAADKPGTDKLSADKPAADKPVPEKPTAPPDAAKPQ